MSQFRIDKRRSAADVTLTTGATLHGSFFVAASHPTRTGSERVADLLNAEPGFLPFETAVSETILLNRAHVVIVQLLGNADEVQLDAGYDMARQRRVAVELSTGSTVSGVVRIYFPAGRDRLSDYTRNGEPFRYIEDGDVTYIVNTAHIVQIQELTS
jgi:hypothetical protein